MFGDYVTRAQARHRYDIGLSYSTQRYDGGNFAALRNVTDGSRNVGTMHGFDTFAVTRAVSVTYGTRFAHYDYLEGKNLLSPRVALVLDARGRHAREHARFAAERWRRARRSSCRRRTPASGCRRSGRSPRLSTAARSWPSARCTWRRESSATSVPRRPMSVRAFSQQRRQPDRHDIRVDSRAPRHARPLLRGEQRERRRHGIRAGVKTVIAERVHGSVEYSFATCRTEARSRRCTYFVLFAPTLAATVHERVHDLTTSIEAEVPETSTRVAFLCRVSNGFARSDLPRRLRRRRPLRRPGAPGAAVHGLQLGQVGNARRGPQLLPRRGVGPVDLRRVARRPVPQARRGRADAQVLNHSRSTVLDDDPFILDPGCLCGARVI